MSNKLIIIGAGNVGGFLSYNIDLFGDYEVMGFLDDDPNKLGQELFGQCVLGSVDHIHDYLDDNLHVVIGIADPKAKISIKNKLSGLPVHFPNFIAPNVWLSKNVSLGKGVVLYPGTTINYGSSIGDFVIINMNCAIGHDCKVFQCSTLAPGVNLGGFTEVGEGVNIGIGASTKQNVKLGKYSNVGGQSMIINDIPDNTSVVGVPGKIYNKSK